MCKRLIIPILLIFIFSCDQKNESNKNDSNLPIEIQNKFGDSIIMLTEKSLGEWKISPNLDTIKYPTRIIYDFDENKKLDFVGIIKNKNQEFPNIVLIKDFNDSKSKIEEIGYVKDYGDYIGSVIYLNKTKNGFYLNNLESSIVEYTWDGNKFIKNYIAD